MDDEFRIPLERRIGSLRAQRDLVQEELRERHRELNSIDRRIEAAEEMYRREFGAEAPETTLEPMMRRATRIRRSTPGQLPWREAVIRTLEDAAKPLHAKEIWRRLAESGFQSDATDPVRSVVAVAIRTEDRIRRAAPNTFELINGNKESAQQQQLISQADDEPVSPDTGEDEA